MDIPFTISYLATHPTLKGSPMSNILNPSTHTHLHDGSHHHPFFLHHHRGSPHGRHRDLLTPDFDVRETTGAYFLEGEFPGIASKEDVRIEWVDARTLSIEAKVAKTDIAKEWGSAAHGTLAKGEEMVDVQSSAQAESSSAGAAAASASAAAPSGDRELHTKDWLSERRVGQYQRTFTFPTEVDIHGVRAKMGQGLLRVLVPKMKATEIKTKKVSVESVEAGDFEAPYP